MNPSRLVPVGFVLVLAGVVLPFLMVIHVLPASLWLSFVSYACSVGGILLGLLGAASIYTERKRLQGDFLDNAAQHPDEPPTTGP